MVKAWIAAAAAALALLAAAGPASAFSKRDVTLTMDDGVTIAATLYLPDATAPAGGWPAVVFLHGLSGKRQDMNALVEGFRFAGEEYAVLTFDARGHGQSLGLVGIDGPREVADTRAVHQWLAARADVADGKIGAWGISYGGGAIFNSLAAGVPWGAAVTVETWTDLHSALVPQGVVKSGLVAGLSGSIPAERKDAELNQVQGDAFAGTNAARVRAWAAARSSLARLGSVRTPVFLQQGRRDFLFGLDQATLAYAKLAGPKRLWMGNHGHTPSTFPAADTPAMMQDARRWFDRWLRGAANGVDREKPVVLAVEGKAATRTFATVPKPAVEAGGAWAPRAAIVQGKKVLVRSAALARPAEVFGAPTVRVTATTSGGWSRLVAVLSARTPGGKEIVVSAGAVPTRNGTAAYAIRLIDQATVVPKGSRWELTLSSSSAAQSAGNLLYLELPMPAGARARLDRVELRVPVLR